MKKTETEGLPEADALPGAPHPRHVYSLVGHQAAEEEFGAPQPTVTAAWRTPG